MSAFSRGGRRPPWGGRGPVGAAARTGGGCGRVPAAPRLMYRVNCNETLWIFVFVDFFHFCLHISFYCVILRENTLTPVKKIKILLFLRHFTNIHLHDKLKLFYSYVYLYQ